ncbi:hypothetical protein ONZ45_g6629 [Pleurotus djamor]|nr:hypothetical protein ONZ45_g6629 [Pleurotus djamor]
MILELRDFLNLPVDVVYQILQHINAEDALMLLRVPSLRALICPSSSEIATPLWRHVVISTPLLNPGFYEEYVCIVDPILISSAVKLPPPPSPQLPHAQISSPEENLPPLCTPDIDMSEVCLSLTIPRHPSSVRHARRITIRAIYLAPEWFTVRAKLGQQAASPTLSRDGSRFDDAVGADEKLGLIERMKPETVKYLERRKRLVTDVYLKETALMKWINQYRDLEKPSRVAAQNILLADLMSRLLALGYDKVMIEYVLENPYQYFTPTLRHYDEYMSERILLHMDPLLSLCRAR